MVFRFGGREIIVDRLDHPRREFFGGEAIPPAHNLANLPARFKQRLNAIQVQRIATGTGFLGPIENRQRLCCLGNRREEAGNIPRAIEAHLDHANFCALGIQIIDRFVDGFAARSHQYNHALRIGCPVIIKQVILPPDDFCKFVHRLLRDGWTGGIKRIHRLTALEVDVGVLRRAAQYRPVRRQAP